VLPVPGSTSVVLVGRDGILGMATAGIGTRFWQRRHADTYRAMALGVRRAL
jgi:hypothetical protein